MNCKAYPVSCDKCSKEGIPRRGKVRKQLYCVGMLGEFFQGEIVILTNDLGIMMLLCNCRNGLHADYICKNVSLL